MKYFFVGTLVLVGTVVLASIVVTGLVAVAVNNQNAVERT